MATVYRVANWTEASAKLKELMGDQPYTLGVGYDYPKPYAVFTKDAWSGEGMGYLVYRTQDDRPRRLLAAINIGGE